MVAAQATLTLCRRYSIVTVSHLTNQARCASVVDLTLSPLDHGTAFHNAAPQPRSSHAESPPVWPSILHSFSLGFRDQAVIYDAAFRPCSCRLRVCQTLQPPTLSPPGARPRREPCPDPVRATRSYPGTRDRGAGPHVCPSVRSDPARDASPITPARGEERGWSWPGTEYSAMARDGDRLSGLVGSCDRPCRSAIALCDGADREVGTRGFGALSC